MTADRSTSGSTSGPTGGSTSRFADRPADRSSVRSTGHRHDRCISRHHSDGGPGPALVRALIAARRLRRSGRNRHRPRYRARRVRRIEPAGARSFRTSLALARALAEPEHAAGRRRLATALEPTTQEERSR